MYTYTFTSTSPLHERVIYTDMKRNTKFLTLIDSWLTIIFIQMITGITVTLSYSLKVY